MVKINDYLARYNNLKGKSENDKTELKTLEKIIFAMQGLKKMQKQYQDRAYDPGKYDTAYFYAAFASENDIAASKKFKPRIYDKCPECSKKNPVMIKYEQTEDSPEGDTWEADAFAICCDKIRTIKHIGGDSRFLHFE